MVNNRQPIPSQAAIGRCLGLSPASVTKCKAMGMPVHSVEAARIWRELHIAPTMHKHSQRSSTQKLGQNRRSENKPVSPSGAVPHALALLGIAASALEGGKCIAAMVPTLRSALHAVPAHERRLYMLLPSEVMDILTAEVAAVLAECNDADECPAPGDSMTESETEAMGRFWYQVAAGEIRPS